MGETRHAERVRSRSPVRKHHHRLHDRRSRSPKRHRDGHRRDKKVESGSKASVHLPFSQKPLSKNDLSAYRPMFSSYLDIQKQLHIEDLEEDEVKGRWKSFVGKWNRAELAEGWYDPGTLTRAQAEVRDGTSFTSLSSERGRRRTSPTYDDLNDGSLGSGQEENDDYGPALPAGAITARSRAAGPSIPTIEDIRERREIEAEKAREERNTSRLALRMERKSEHKLQQDKLDEIAPRAEAGTRERQLEKKREKAASNKAFADARERSPEFRDDDVMGGGEEIADIKRTKKDEQRKKNEREIRREEILRARTAEREERMKGMREKEDRTVAMLRELAQSRFGGHTQS